MACSEKQLAAAKRHRTAHPTAAKEATTKWRAANPEKVRAKKRRAHGRMSDEKRAFERVRLQKWRDDNREKERTRSWRKQGLPEPTRPCPENCEICGRAAWLETRAFALDHDHSTGAFRGWLCSPCNTALGLFGDNRQVLEKAIAYLGGA
jgi:recombination endonuclease VII